MMRMHAMQGLGVVGLCAALASGCCPELREVAQREAIDAMPASGTTQHFSFTTEDCFDEQKEVLLAVLWKGGKQKATVALNELEIAKFPEQTCDLLEQAVQALGDAVGGAIDDAIGDIGCLFHVVQGPEFTHDDQVLIQDLKKEGFKWQLFKLSKGSVLNGKNDLSFVVANSDQQCTGEDKRTTTRMAYVLISDVDNACDEKFRK
ncbi:MAG: hypothetical protein ABIJ09_27105 [Pseudomonadota bacterium]